MNPGQRSCPSPPSSAVSGSRGRIDNLTQRLRGRVTAGSSGLLGASDASLPGDYSLIFWSMACVIWGNVVDDFCPGNMNNESSEYRSSLSCT